MLHRSDDCSADVTCVSSLMRYLIIQSKLLEFLDECCQGRSSLKLLLLPKGLKQLACSKHASFIMLTQTLAHCQD